MAEPPELGTNCEDSKAKRQPEGPQMLSRVLHSDREPVSVSSTQISDDSSDQKGLGSLILSSPVEVMDRLSLLEPIVHLAFESTALFLPDRHADPVDRSSWVVVSSRSQQRVWRFHGGLVSGSTRRPPITGGAHTKQQSLADYAYTHRNNHAHLLALSTRVASLEDSASQHSSHRAWHCWSA